MHGFLWHFLLIQNVITTLHLLFMATSGLMHITLLLPVTQYITVYYALMISYLYQIDAVLQELMILVSHLYLMLSSRIQSFKSSLVFDKSSSTGV